MLCHLRGVRMYEGQIRSVWTGKVIVQIYIFNLLYIGANQDNFINMSMLSASTVAGIIRSTLITWWAADQCWMIEPASGACFIKQIISLAYSVKSLSILPYHATWLHGKGHYNHNYSTINFLHPSFCVSAQLASKSNASLNGRGRNRSSSSRRTPTNKNHGSNKKDIPDNKSIKSQSSINNKAGKSGTARAKSRAK